MAEQDLYIAINGIPLNDWNSPFKPVFEHVEEGETLPKVDLNSITYTITFTWPGQKSRWKIPFRRCKR